jgi:hypothetical protein
MRAGERGFTAVEAAAFVAVIGSVLAVAVPTFVRDFHASHLVEATSGLERIGAAAVAAAEGHAPAEAFPPSAPRTPALVPKGVPAVDPPGTWDHPTWQELSFRPVTEGHPHRFAFGFASADGARGGAFTARAEGDLDGDGLPSTFELSGVADAEGAHVAPGLYVRSELE